MSQISQLPTAADFDTSSLFAIDNPDPNSSGDYLTRKVSAAEIADYIANDLDYTTDLDTTNKKITGAINELKAKTDIEDINFTVVSSSIADVKIRAVRYGNIVMITGYFRTTASIPDGTTIFSGMANPITPTSDGNLYFNLLNENDGTPQRFRINSPYADFKNQGTLASGKTFVGTVTYICQ